LLTGRSARGYGTSRTILVPGNTWIVPESGLLNPAMPTSRTGIWPHPGSIIRNHFSSGTALHPAGLPRNPYGWTLDRHVRSHFQGSRRGSRKNCVFF